MLAAQRVWETATASLVQWSGEASGGGALDSKDRVAGGGGGHWTQAGGAVTTGNTRDGAGGFSRQAVDLLDEVRPLLERQAHNMTLTVVTEYGLDSLTERQGQNVDLTVF